MLNGLISGLILAWILTPFKVDEIFIEVLQPFVGIALNTSHFYFVLGCIGIIGGLLCRK